MEGSRRRFFSKRAFFSGTSDLALLCFRGHPTPLSSSRACGVESDLGFSGCQDVSRLIGNCRPRLSTPSPRLRRCGGGLPIAVLCASPGAPPRSEPSFTLVCTPASHHHPDGFCDPVHCNATSVSWQMHQSPSSSWHGLWSPLLRRAQKHPAYCSMNLRGGTCVVDTPFSVTAG